MDTGEGQIYGFAFFLSLFFVFVYLYGLYTRYRSRWVTEPEILLRNRKVTKVISQADIGRQKRIISLFFLSLPVLVLTGFGGGLLGIPLYLAILAAFAYLYDRVDEQIADGSNRAKSILRVMGWSFGLIVFLALVWLEVIAVGKGPEEDAPLGIMGFAMMMFAGAMWGAGNLIYVWDILRRTPTGKADGDFHLRES